MHSNKCGTHSNPTQRALSGGSAGAAAAFLTAPLDLVKTRLQAQHTPQHLLPQKTLPKRSDLLNLKYGGVARSFRLIVAEEGALGLFKGLSPTLLGMIPSWSVYFTTYSTAKDYLQKYSGDNNLTSLHHMAAATIAGLATCSATNPLWVVKIRLQTQFRPGFPCFYDGIIDCFIKIVRYEGVRGLYKGLSASCLGVSHVAIQFPLYEHFKSILEGESVEFYSLYSVIGASTVSKAIASTITYPHEVVRTRMQHYAHSKHYRSVFHAFRKIARSEGYHAFYKGMGTNLLRVVPSCAINFCVYEQMVKFLVERNILTSRTHQESFQTV
eukprot:138024_1